MVLLTQASPVWNAVFQATTTIDAELGVATEETCTPILGVCPTWLSQTPIATPISHEADRLPQPTTSQDIPATSAQSHTLTESTCTIMRWRAIIMSILIPTSNRIITANMVMMRWMAFHIILTPHCDRQGTATCPAATNKPPRVCRRLWWLST